MSKDTRALIENGVVREILVPVPDFTFEQCFPKNIIQNSIPCGPDVEIDWTYADGKFSPPPPPPVPSVKDALDAKLSEVLTAYSAAFAPINAVYPAAEREGWAMQEAEARALTTDPTAQTPVLTALAQIRARGESAADLAAKVLANAGQYRMLYAYLTGQQQRMYGEVSALAAQDGITGADIAAYPVVYQLPPGM